MQSTRDIVMVQALPNSFLSRISTVHLTGQNHGCNPETAVFRDFQEKIVNNLPKPTTPCYPQLTAALRHYNLLPFVITLTAQ